MKSRIMFFLRPEANYGRLKLWLILIIVSLIAFGCANNQTTEVDMLPDKKNQEKVDNIFHQVEDFPTIKDTAVFIADLKQFFGLDVDESNAQKELEEITTYEKVKLFGSDKEYFLLEYDYKVGCGAAYPYKYQIILDTKGHLVKVLNGLRYEFIEIFKGENPFLLVVSSTSKGNGGHDLFKLTNDTLENVFDNNQGYSVLTYDAHEDNAVNEPCELNLKIYDFNGDGYNDISFYGNILLLQGQTAEGDFYDAEIKNGKTIPFSSDNPFMKIPVEFVFLFDKQTGHFKTTENYTKKYGLED
ncbi:MAG: hypothetical protein R2809_08245 [Flavobacteriales bacterium]